MDDRKYSQADERRAWLGRCVVTDTLLNLSGPKGNLTPAQYFSQGRRFTQKNAPGTFGKENTTCPWKDSR